MRHLRGIKEAAGPDWRRLTQDEYLRHLRDDVPDHLSPAEAERLMASRVDPLVGSGRFLYHEAVEWLSTVEASSGAVRWHVWNRLGRANARLDEWARLGTFMSLTSIRREFPQIRDQGREGPGDWVRHLAAGPAPDCITVSSYGFPAGGPRDRRRSMLETMVQVAKSGDDWLRVRHVRRVATVDDISVPLPASRIVAVPSWRIDHKVAGYYLCDGESGARSLMASLAESDAGWSDEAIKIIGQGR